MADYKWPDAQHRTLIGTRQTRVDGPVKVSGRAKYTYDQNPKGLLAGAILRCPHAHAKIVSVDTSAAEKIPGVKAVQVLQGPGKEIHWAGDEIVALAAINEGIAEDALRAIKVQYDVLPHFVDDLTEPQVTEETTGPISLDELIARLSTPVGGQYSVSQSQIADAVRKRGISFPVTPELVQRLRENGVGEDLINALQSAKVMPATAAAPYRKAAAQTQGDPDKAFQSAEITSGGLYGASVITHCCLEAHGVIAHWPDAEHLETQVSTQNVSGIPDQLAQALTGAGIDISASNIHNQQQHIGGGFGSKFAADRWSLAAAQLSKKAGGAPVKIMLDRRAELEVAGARPSAYAHVKLAAKKDGTITGVGFAILGNGRPAGWKHAAHPVHLHGNSPPAETAHLHRHQHRPHARLACTQSPAGCRAHHVRH